MQASRRLIVNADDFGLCEAVNEGVIAAHEEGIVTAASLMVRPPGARDAAGYARGHPSLDVGLHVDLGEWTLRQGTWAPLYEVVPLDSESQVRNEVLRQCARFEALTGRAPSHLDSHQHVHRREPLRAIIAELGRRLSVPVRHLTHQVRYCGNFYGQCEDGSSLPRAISVEHLVELLTRLPGGVTELACHPGAGAVPETMYSSEREVELRTLCDPRVRRAIEAGGITLSTFLDCAYENGRVEC
jgi:predicted glycoside hydrolase/deacetylase ChbG (UPF0249 family)